MKKRKFAAGLLTLVSVVTLAACSSTKDSSDIVTMKGDTIHVTDLYEEVKNTSSAQNALLRLVMYKVLDEKYGDKVSDDEVNDAYNEAGEQYGSDFSSILSQAGLDQDSYKRSIRLQKLTDYALETAAKAQITDADYEAAFEDYTPEVTVEVIQMTDEEEAKSTLEEVKKDDADFAKIAKEKTVAADSQVEYKFDSASTDLPSVVKEAAFDLKKDGISDVITYQDTSTYSNIYFIVKVTDKTEKSSNWKDYEDILKDIVINNKVSNQNFSNQVISDLLTEANVKIKDDAFSNLLTQFTVTEDSEESSSSEEKSEEKTEESSEEASEEEATEE